MNTIFYSWQSDRNKTTCRNLIERALKDVIEQIHAEASVASAERPDDAGTKADHPAEPQVSTAKPALRLDKDTQGVPGSPPIAETIFQKIENAAIFVPDLTFIAQRPDGRPCSNPNVLIEYGWALKSLGHERIIPVMNTAYGEPNAQSLPFDMIHMRHPIQFNCAEGAGEDERREARTVLAKQLREALTLAIGALPAIEPSPRPAFASSFANDAARFRPTGPLGMLENSLGPIGPMLGLRKDSQIWLEDGPSMWLRIMPRYALPGTITTRKIQDKLIHNGTILHALNSGHYQGDIHFMRGADGVGVCIAPKARDTDDGQSTRMISYALTSGEIWCIDALTMGYIANQLIFSESEYTQTLESAAALLRRLGVAGPYRWIAGISGAAGRRLADERGHQRGSAILSEEIVVDGEFSDESGAAPAALAPFFDAVRQAAHL
ncbi:MAG: hypothetical protein HKL99_10435 [Burkholderiales bacterium]|nr:hypothetical protein [Burkholderiales bacterium]